MSRPKRAGVDYFPLDVGILRDTKVRLIKGEFGIIGVYIYLTILISIYEDNGYFKEWSDDVCILVSDEVGCGCNFKTVAEVVKGCCRRLLFDEGVLNASGVLTSAGIQRRFIRAASQRDDIEIIQEYWLLDNANKNDVPDGTLNKLAFKRVSTSHSPDKTSHNPDKMSDNPQSKVKESKEEHIVHSDACASKCTEREINGFFESVWALYPEKKGKGQVSLTQKKKLLKIGVEELSRCISRYKANKEDWRKYQNGSTFFNSGYVDYLDKNFNDVRKEPDYFDDVVT